MSEALAALFQIDGTTFSRCLAAGLNCAEPAIRAHSIQNARHLGLLEQDGHVVTLARRFDANLGPIVDFATVGRNRATTFTGLCARHDQTIFSPIEVGVLDIDSLEHRFLLAYRATIREFHATLEAGKKVQVAYLRGVELGIDSRGAESQAGLLAVERMIVAHQTYLYKCVFDAAYGSRQFAALDHDLFVWDRDEPKLAACALFSLDELDKAGEPLRACLNIIPLDSGRTAVLFSYTTQDSALARTALSAVLGASGSAQRYQVSKLLLNSCENLVIAPRHFATWSDKKKQAIRDYFTRTILQSDLKHDDEELDLF